MTRVFQLLMALMSAGACVCYAWDGDWRRALYWFFATGITVAVTI